jgi:hypothetical protein
MAMRILEEPLIPRLKVGLLFHGISWYWLESPRVVPGLASGWQFCNSQATRLQSSDLLSAFTFVPILELCPRGIIINIINIIKIVMRITDPSSSITNSTIIITINIIVDIIISIINITIGISINNIVISLQISSVVVNIIHIVNVIINFVHATQKPTVHDCRLAHPAIHDHDSRPRLLHLTIYIVYLHD